jgi:hypothetical protein
VRLETAAPRGLTHLAAAGTVVIAAMDDGSVAVLDPGTGRAHTRRSIGGRLELFEGGGRVWALDRAGHVVMALDPDGTPAATYPARDVRRIAADASRPWWTSTRDTRLHTIDRAVEPGVDPAPGGLTVCANSVWLSAAEGLCRVNAWSGEVGRLVPSPGPLPWLTCARGVLVGAAPRDAIVVLDPSADADLRVLPVESAGTIGALVALGRAAWLFAAERPEVHVIRF